MKSIKDILAIVVAIAAAIFALYEFYLFATFTTPQGRPDMQGGTHYLWWAIGATVVAIICGLIYFVGHVNKEEEIHITQ